MFGLTKRRGAKRTKLGRYASPMWPMRVRRVLIVGVGLLCLCCANVMLPSDADAATPGVSANFVTSTTQVSVSGRVGRGTVRAARRRSAWRVMLEEEITSGKRGTWVVCSHAALRSKAGVSTFATKWTVPTADRENWLRLRLVVLAGRVVVTRSAAEFVRLPNSRPSGSQPTQPSQPPASITGPAIWRDAGLGAGLAPVTPISGQLTGLTEVFGGVWTVYADGTANLEVGPSSEFTFRGSSLPLQASLSGVASVTGNLGLEGRTVLILKTDGTVWTEGDGSSGEFGNGTQGTGDYSSTPVQVPGLSDVTQIASGPMSDFALKADGTVWEWGNIVASTVPVKNPRLSNVVWLAGGGGPDGIAVESNGTVWVWGCEANDIHGDGPNNAVSATGQVPGLTGITRVFFGDSGTGDDTAFAIGVGGQVWAWGANPGDETGTVSAGSRWPAFSEPVSSPTEVPNVSDAVAVGYDLILRGDGGVYDWNNARQGTAVAPTLASTPTGAALLGGSYVFVP